MIEISKLERYLKKSKLPTIYCPGCGIGLAMKAMISAFCHLDFNHRNTIVVSGIGCTARAPGYLEFDTVNTLHGRALPIAQGIKKIRPDLNVVVFSGDGDLLSIGIGHLIHALRRGMKITTILINNNIYGLTGGQCSPTSPFGTVSPTTPLGSKDNPIDVKSIILGFKNIFYGRSTCFHLDHLENIIIQGLKWSGFSLIEVISPCLSGFFKQLGFKKPIDVYYYLRDKYQIKSKTDGDLKDNELGFITT